MRDLGIVLVQIVIAILVAGAVLPAFLMSVPAARSIGPFTMAGIVLVLFVLLRLAWPKKK